MIPVCEPALLGNERKYVLDAIETGWISSAGKYLPAFEKAFAKYCGVKHGIAVSNGTAALHLAFVALGINKGDEVIMPNFTMIASAFAVCYTGAMPVFVDAEPETWNIDTTKIEEKITERTKAIMPVHIYGHPCNMQPIWDLAKKYDLKIIEDAAEVHGAEYNGKKCGSLGDIAAFSFYANKIATTGEGGMVVTDNDELAEKCRYYKNLCFPLKGDRSYIHNDIGFNYRMSNIHAAIGLAQIELADQYVQMRRYNNSLYKKYLKNVPGIKLQPEKEWAKNVYWMNGIVVNYQEYGMNRDELMIKLREKGIDSRLFFTGMHRQPSLKKYGCNFSGEYPVSDWLTKNGLYLPSGSGLKEENIKYIWDTIRKIRL
ncbi:MAG: DegT/DnrJ/EryC1/StrS family aminotransferase [Candidatus Helarchaeota archaeon]